MRFGEKLSFLRKQRGMTQMELAEKLDISRQAVSRWEQGISEPSTENLVSIGKLFDVTVDTLVNEDVQLQIGSAVQIAVKDQDTCENTDFFRESNRVKLSKQVVTACCTVVILVLVVFLCCFGMWVSSQKTKKPVPVDELNRTELDDGSPDGFDMEKLEE